MKRLTSHRTRATSSFCSFVSISQELLTVFLLTHVARVDHGATPPCSSVNEATSNQDLHGAVTRFHDGLKAVTWEITIGLAR